MVYNLIVASIARKNFERVNAQDYAPLLRSCAPDIHHRFGGDHALGGERHDREALGRWFERLGRCAPGLKLEVQDIWVKGPPWATTCIMRWTASATAADGSAYRNHGVHVIRMRWGTVVAIDANEDSQAVERMLRIAEQAGIVEAGMPPITS